MTNRIKFRQFIGGQMVYWGLIEQGQFTGPHSSDTENFGTTPHMQFTGLLDKNGKEIYEGDVVKGMKGSASHGMKTRKEKESTFEISWSESMNAWYMREIPSISWNYRNLPFWKEVEIIGNAHEHPNLLN